jgi:hypothetical protein
MPAIAGDLRDPVKQDPPPDGDPRRDRAPHRDHPGSRDRPSPENGLDPARLPGRAAGFQRNTESSQA